VNVNKMSLILTTALFFYAASTFAAPEPADAKMQTKAGLYVTPAEAYEMLTNQKERKVVLIDVRDPVEIMFTGFTDMAAANVPFKIVDDSVWDAKRGLYQANTNREFVADTEAVLEKLGAGNDSDIIFMCRSGSSRSGPAADVMYEAGYKNVYSMINGFEGHKEKEGPHKGARVVNGWKNDGLPWGWKLDEEKMYVVIR
jgi:rhodanese-related sulfurtransferase